MDKAVRIAAVIINYKTPDLTLAAVRSLYMQMDAQRDAIFVVDNCSDDGSLEILREAFANEAWPGRIELLASDRNGGFSYGNNFAMCRVDAEAYLLLNSDAELDPDALSMMWDALQAEPRRGLVGPLMHGDDGALQHSCFVDRSPWSEFLATAKTGVLTRLFENFGVREVASQAPGGEARDVDWLSFVCVMIRGETFRDVGPMDDGYFMYREDNDYSRRARQKGWSVYYQPQASAMHLNKGWSGKELARQPAFYYESRARYFRKFYGFLGFLSANLLWTLGRMIRRPRELLQGRPTSVAISAWRDIWTMRVGNKPLTREV
ncbi:MAG: glycosyltransferase family 2 protein [Methylomonas sp.]|nr:glycosyltransferase family 2 protein [Methylomonas sp.]